MFPSQILLEDSSSIMNDYQADLFLNLPRSKSDDSNIDKLLFSTQNQFEKRPLFMELDEVPNQSIPIKVFTRRSRKQRKKTFCDYRKNICGYITKKIIREFVSSTFSRFVTTICQNHGCTYPAARQFYLERMDKITGPTHIPQLLIPKDNSETAIKAVFRQFFEWFLRERYMRYLLLEGKMENKQAYIQYKNRNLMMLLEDNDKKIEQRHIEMETESSSISSNTSSV